MATKRKKKLNNNVYFAEQIVWRGGRWYKKNSDGSLFSGVYKTKIYPEDLPEWYLFGRYYKRFGYMSTKGITDMVYRPSKWSNHFLKDDFLFISYNEKIRKIDNPQNSLDEYEGYDEMVYGHEVLEILKGAREYSNYDITPFIQQLKEKKKWLIETFPEEFGKWDFDIDEWFEKPIQRYVKQPTIMADVCEEWEKEANENDTTD